MLHIHIQTCIHIHTYLYKYIYTHKYTSVSDSWANTYSPHNEVTAARP